MNHILCVTESRRRCHGYQICHVSCEIHAEAEETVEH
jgi:hypothetical protein